MCKYIRIINFASISRCDTFGTLPNITCHGVLTFIKGINLRHFQRNCNSILNEIVLCMCMYLGFRNLRAWH